MVQAAGLPRLTDVNRHKRIPAVFVVVVMICLALMLTEQAGAEMPRQRVRIRSDGSVDPSSAAIQRSGDTYTFTGDVYAELVVEKGGIVIDGAGHTLMGPYNGSQTLWIIGEGPNQTPTGDTELWSIGIDTVSNAIDGLTVRNLNIKNFSIGMYLWTRGNTVTGNAITDCIVGILLSGNDNTITENYVADNKNGVYFGSNQPGNIPTGVVLAENCFVDNLRQLSGCVCVDFNTTEEVHTWDNGKRGNFWSDYMGTDANGDGVGDTAYVIDPLNMDRFPLMQSPAAPPKATAVDVHIVVAVAAVALALAVVAVVLVLRRRKKPAKD
ncbi:MAG: nitrous oxide reductase family maturation protein NosD [Candidatus Bathyarchaeia archaeon]